VRYERARIARELHDIVAHHLSVVVIQAAAGQRLCGTDHGAAAEALTAIAEAAGSAQAEIGRVVRRHTTSFERVAQGYPGIQFDYGQAAQFATTMQCGGPFGPDSTFCDTVLSPTP
jgi:hypothetical protein